MTDPHTDEETVADTIRESTGIDISGADWHITSPAPLDGSGSHHIATAGHTVNHPERPTADLLCQLRTMVDLVTSGWLGTDQLASYTRPLATLANAAADRLAMAVSPLTIPQVRSLAAIEHAAKTRAHIARLMPSGEVIQGVARHIVVDTVTVAFPTSADDVRTCYLRVTGATGLGEYFWPLTELMPEHHEQTFVIYGQD